MGQENLIPDYGGHQDDGSETLLHFTVAEGQIVGDRNALKVLECLTSIQVRLILKENRLDIFSGY